jgi:hypothetical protein
MSEHNETMIYPAVFYYVGEDVENVQLADMPDDGVLVHTVTLGYVQVKPSVIRNFIKGPPIRDLSANFLHNEGILLWIPRNDLKDIVFPVAPDVYSGRWKSP